MYLQTVGVNDFIADGALHEHEVKLLLFILGGVLFARLSTDETHCRVRQDRLHGQTDRGEKEQVCSKHPDINTAACASVWKLDLTNQILKSLFNSILMPGFVTAYSNDSETRKAEINKVLLHNIQICALSSIQLETERA